MDDHPLVRFADGPADRRAASRDRKGPARDLEIPSNSSVYREEIDERIELDEHEAATAGRATPRAIAGHSDAYSSGAVGSARWTLVS
jgi:hypothetical protein